MATQTAVRTRLKQSKRARTASDEEEVKRSRLRLVQGITTLEQRLEVAQNVAGDKQPEQQVIARGWGLGKRFNGNLEGAIVRQARTENLAVVFH